MFEIFFDVRFDVAGGGQSFGDGDPRVLERDRRLSESMIWRLQRAFFEKQGIEAWRTGVVPHYITNNPVLAHAYAEVVLAYARAARPSLLHIVELGSGSGRFAHYFLRALLEREPISDTTFRLVMTDLADANLMFWPTMSSTASRRTCSPSNKIASTCARRRSAPAPKSSIPAHPTRSPSWS